MYEFILRIIILIYSVQMISIWNFLMYMFNLCIIFHGNVIFSFWKEFLKNNFCVSVFFFLMKNHPFELHSHLYNKIQKSLSTLLDSFMPPCTIHHIPCQASDHYSVCYFCMLCLVAKSCLTLCDLWTVACLAPLSVGILQARILEWAAMPSSRDLPNPGIESSSPTLQADSLPFEQDII